MTSLLLIINKKSLLIGFNYKLEWGIKMEKTLFKRIKGALPFILTDILAICLTYLVSVFVFYFLEIEISIDKIAMALPFIVLAHFIAYLIVGVYGMLPDFFGFEDFIRIAATTIVVNILIVVFLAVTRMTFMYKSAYFFIVFLEIGIVVLPRMMKRVINYFKTNWDWNKALGRRTLIVGAGAAGEQVVKELYRNKDLNNMPMCFLDDDKEKHDKRLMGIKIAGSLSEISYYLDLYRIEEVIIAVKDFPVKKTRELGEIVTSRNIRIKKLSGMVEDVGEARPIISDIRIEDLLNREEIQLDDNCIANYIQNEVVLVTGGGGSIGSELCRQIAERQPKQLIIFDIYENNAYEIQQELLRTFKKANKTLDLQVWIGSVYNRARVKKVFETFKPSVVFHAAAYKHVPLMEDSAVEAVRTNVIGTYNVSSLANEFKVKKFVMVSSDKAVRSTNVMGATKRYAELIVQEQQNHSKDTIYSAVRFGNVLGSNGSVIPLFKKQIADGGPITVTHPEITRYFMTIPEAVGLILQCGVFAKGGEVFILDMGEPVKIKDLAEKMIRLTGLRPNEDIKIEFVGLRPGEKLYEELLVDHDNGSQDQTPHEKIFIEKQRDVQLEELNLDQMFKELEILTNEEVKECLATIITTYNRNGNGTQD